MGRLLFASEAAAMPYTLEEIIKDEIRSAGPITFARFMELALYHPELGYYSSGRARIGKDGDFYTSPHVSPVFGRLVAEYYLKLKAPLRADGCSFVEVGAGEGYLAKDFLEFLHRHHHRDFMDCNYAIVEISPGMRHKQQETLGSLAGRVKWYSCVEELPSPLTGVIFSNEFVDALPFHRVRGADCGSIKELFVTLVEGALAETMDTISTPLLARHFNRLDVRLEDGVTTEVNLNACSFINSLSKRLDRGFVITVDYGYPAPEYYSPERVNGTMMCYRGHTSSETPYLNIGEQDITSHVDFSTLALEGKEAGLVPELFCEQGSFLTDALSGLVSSLTVSAASQGELGDAGLGLTPLVHPDWMGAAFKVLVQSKGISDPALFSGVRNRADSL